LVVVYGEGEGRTVIRAAFLVGFVAGDVEDFALVSETVLGRWWSQPRGRGGKDGVGGLGQRSGTLIAT